MQKRRDGTPLDLLAEFPAVSHVRPVVPPELIEVRNGSVALERCRFKEDQQALRETYGTDGRRMFRANLVMFRRRSGKQVASKNILLSALLS